MDGPAVSSSSGSGVARFFPLGSRIGSLIVKGLEVDGGLRRGLRWMKA